MKKHTPPLSSVAAPVCAPCSCCSLSQPKPSKLCKVMHVMSAWQSPVARLLRSALSSNQRLNLAITLPLRNQPELTSLLDRLYDPTSSDYRQFLTVDQFTEQFGPTAQDYQAVVSFARANGFTVTDMPKNRLLVDINGTVAQIENAFHVVMTVYKHPTEDRTFFSPDREPSLDLSVPVNHIAGLNNYSIPHPKLKRAPADQPIQSHAGSGPGGATLPEDMRAAYYAAQLSPAAASLSVMRV